MQDTMITVVGNVVDDPDLRTLDSGDVASFRVGSTSRRFDRASDKWIDNRKLYLGVSCWGALAHNVKASIQKGQPVVIWGSIYQTSYVKDEQPRVSYEMKAYAVGHDLARGTARFQRPARVTTSVMVDDGGVPEHISDAFLEEQLRQADAFAGEDAPSAARRSATVSAAVSAAPVRLLRAV